MAGKKNNQAEEVTQKLFDLLQITEPFELKESDEAIDIVMNPEDSGIIIGRHGETLSSLQLILSLCISKKTGTYKRVNLEVGDYKKNREEYLESLAEQTKQRALAENREVVLSDLKPWERRIIHLFLQEDEEVTSESAGDGQERVLIVKPK